MFRGCFVIDGILVLIIVGKSSLGLLIFFGNGMCVLISWLIYDLFIESHFIGIIDFHLGFCLVSHILILLYFLSFFLLIIFFCYLRFQPS